jgi:DNA-nicking Smr family endonuclease
MMKVLIDFHGSKLVQAVQVIEDLIADVRKRSETADAELIVGHGVIRQKLLSLLKSYGLKPLLKLGNDGVIICILE